ncbi:MAG: hypothetical protein GX463_02330 [Methanothrix sp.]|nr:hypothetical protein [Methanothrix sp.]
MPLTDPRRLGGKLAEEAFTLRPGPIAIFDINLVTGIQIVKEAQDLIFNQNIPEAARNIKSIIPVAQGIDGDNLRAIPFAGSLISGDLQMKSSPLINPDISDALAPIIVIRPLCSA